MDHAIPYHAQILFQKFAFGMGINTMQGREAKHSVIAKFAAHALWLYAGNLFSVMSL